MRYLVTGGCGFIGSHLVEALLGAGHGVTVIDDLSTGKRENLPLLARDLRLVVGDAADAALVRRLMAGVDGCFHLAAVASVQRCTEEWFASHRSNMASGVAVYAAAAEEGRARGRPCPVVYASSAAVYGDSPALPLREEAPARPMSAYGADKYGLELHGAVAARIHGVPTCGFRFFNVFGPRQDPSSPYSGVISIFARRIRAGEGIVIHGDGGQTRDFVYVADVVEAMTAGMARLEEAEAPEALVCNVCRGEGVSVRAAAEAIARISGRPLKAAHGPARAGDIRASVGDPSRLKAELGVSARRDFEAGLRLFLGDGRRNAAESAQAAQKDYPL